ncbi:MAG: MBL fold metallo-hydrolase [Euryarchaeota archaeon]|nr:MBL fold metallo-hydrolase [Euryarchaeota archaeon]
MRLEFHGGAGGVTGSHTVLDTGRARIGIDAGMFQGGDGADGDNRRGFGHDVRDLRALLLTHAHIDHSGRVPLLVRSLPSADVFATAATADLCDLMLRDSAHLMEEEALHGRHHPEQGRWLPPLYGEEDVAAALRRFRTVQYGESLDIAGLSVRFRDAGHILGSAMLEIDTGLGTLVMSGDLGRPGAPILRDPHRPAGADWLVLESTYGDREHPGREDRGRALLDIVRETVRRGGNVVLPAFAVGRTQEILFELNRFAERGELGRVPVFVDSPMAISAKEIYGRHPECYDAETRALLARGDDPLDFSGMKLARSKQESKKINDLREPHIIISASGMCSGGRVVHHLAQNIGREDSTILFVGFQAGGTTGRRLRDGGKRIRLFGKEFDVRARIEALDSFSAHAGRSELLDWLGGFRRFPGTVVLNHGEPSASESLAREIRHRFGADVRVAAPGSRVELG